MAVMNAPDPLGYEDLPRLMSLMSGDEKHDSAATSTLDVLWVLYDRVLRISPSGVRDPRRDRFVLSKGHGPVAYYAILAVKGFVPVDWLSGFARFESALGHHPDRCLIPGVEVSSGSLGHGLPIAVGMALAIQRGVGHRPRVVTLIGDGELDEGSNHEAIALAGRLGLDGLSVVVIDNASSSHGWPGGIASRFGVEGWWTAVVDGGDHDAVEAALVAPTGGRPRAVVARVEAK